MIAFEDYGCYLAVIDGTLFFCGMNQDGSPDMDDDNVPNFGEVTAPFSQAFLDTVNAHFKTNFRMNQFAGR